MTSGALAGHRTVTVMSEDGSGRVRFPCGQQKVPMAQRQDLPAADRRPVHTIRKSCSQLPPPPQPFKRKLSLHLGLLHVKRLPTYDKIVRKITCLVNTHLLNKTKQKL
ncbi:unnamed protein product [Rangifer tarandus platyrhynchus]|uniref:Uncharacterized protein n=1 Tax=Rangifer tarandus platyrhynchus TaxID=3082113 RepID=A0ABN8ZTU2_RANTA|nr:unnamed protein product [Rangifer tarandus platyrhynchus]